jgi:hypothetical protein
MIKLTVNPNNNPVVKIFDQKMVTIGSGDRSFLADLSLSGKELQPIHIKIMKEGSRFVVVNFANDPFVTLNGLPFGKKTLKNRDLLEIGTLVILIEFEGAENSADKLPPPLAVNAEMEIPPQNDPLNATLEKLIQASQPSSDSFSTNHSHIPYSPLSEADSDSQLPQDNSLEKSDLVDLIQEVDQFEEASPSLLFVKKKEEERGETPHPATSQYVTLPNALEISPNHLASSKEKLSKTTPNQPSKKNYPEYQLGEFDDENESWTTDKEGKPINEMEAEEQPSRIHWKLIGTIVLATLLILSLVAGALYYNFTAKNEIEELRAAEGVADIAMALKYAQIHHIKPQKKNWSDPEFIKRSLANVIPHDYPTLAKIDSQGHLNDTSYALRIYTSTDFSQFIVIAQPAPSVFQWLMPKTAIVIDSKLMQLKKVVDMKTLNRLLVNSNNLDNSNAVEVTHLVKRGELIPLSTLAKKRKGQEFSPPKALVLLRPGAENYIYNAPRYYQLGETIIKRAIGLMGTPGSVYEMSRLKQDMSLLSKMHDMVLYSSDGIQLTLDAQKAIAAFVSNARFLTAYLKFDSDGTINSSHLIFDDESARYQHVPEKTIVEPIKHEEVLTEAEPQKMESIATVPLQDDHPLLNQLVALCTNREKALQPIKSQIFALISEDSQHPIEHFDARFNALTQDYIEADLMQKHEMAKGIQKLAEDYRLMPLDEFVDYLNQAGLGNGCKEILKHAVKAEGQQKKLQGYIDDIKTSDNFSQIEKVLNKANRWLVVKNYQDLGQLQMAHKIIKTETLARIGKLMLSSMPKPLELEFDEEQFGALQHILQMTTEKHDEQIYYLKEFERMMKPEDEG